MFSAPHQPEGDHDGHDHDEHDEDDQQDLGESHSAIAAGGGSGVDGDVSGDGQDECASGLGGHLGGDLEGSTGDGLSVEGDGHVSSVSGVDDGGDGVGSDGEFDRFGARLDPDSVVLQRDAASDGVLDVSFVRGQLDVRGILGFDVECRDT